MLYGRFKLSLEQKKDLFQEITDFAEKQRFSHAAPPHAYDLHHTHTGAFRDMTGDGVKLTGKNRKDNAAADCGSPATTGSPRVTEKSERMTGASPPPSKRQEKPTYI